MEDAVFGNNTGIGIRGPSASDIKEMSTFEAKDSPIQRQFFVRQPTMSSANKNDKQFTSVPQNTSYSKSADSRRPNQSRNGSTRSREGPEDSRRSRPHDSSWPRERPEGLRRSDQARDDSTRLRSRQDDSRSRRDEPSHTKDRPHGSRSNWPRDEQDTSTRRNHSRSRHSRQPRPDSKQGDSDRTPIQRDQSPVHRQESRPAQRDRPKATVRPSIVPSAASNIPVYVPYPVSYFIINLKFVTRFRELRQ